MNYWLLGYLGSVGLLVGSLGLGYAAAKRYIALPYWLGNVLFYTYFGSFILMAVTFGGALAMQIN